MDPTLNGTIRHILDTEGTKTIGLSGKADIGLNGIGYVLLLSFLNFSRSYIYIIFYLEF